jgi:hypothetical protein
MDLDAELESMLRFCDLAGKEFLHYGKHMVRGWWQETEERKFKHRLTEIGPSLKGIKIDHKSKTKPMKKFEAMSDYFSKSGMSLLGAMISWAGKKTIDGEAVDGLYIWFVDMIMSNVTSQEARDLMPCFEALFEELQSPEFKAKGGETKQVHLFSDNALSAAPHSPYLHALNEQMSGLIEILGWTNNEAQRGKDFLDAHFSYMLKQLKKAILQGEIKFTDQYTFYDSLTYDGGMTASAALLVEELDAAQRVCQTCDNALPKKKRGGISSVYDIDFSHDDKVTHRKFANLDAHKKDFTPSLENWPLELEATGRVVKRFYSKSEPMFLPFERRSKFKNYQPPNERTFQGRLYQSVKRILANGGTVGESANQTMAQGQEISGEVLELVGIMKETFPTEYPPELTKNWAKKTNRLYLNINDEAGACLRDMFTQGQGYTNKHLRYTSEKAFAEIQQGILLRCWDQKLVLSNARIKSFFGRRFADEKKTNDAMRGTTKNTVSEQFDEAMQQRDESGEINGVVDSMESVLLDGTYQEDGIEEVLLGMEEHQPATSTQEENDDFVPACDEDFS